MPATVMPGPDQVTPRRVRFEDGERGDNRVPNHVHQMAPMGGELGVGAQGEYSSMHRTSLSVLSAQDLLYGSGWVHFYGFLNNSFEGMRRKILV